MPGVGASELVNGRNSGALSGMTVLDVMMPGMDGLETMGAARELPGFEAAPVVFTTAEEIEVWEQHRG